MRGTGESYGLIFWAFSELSVPSEGLFFKLEESEIWWVTVNKCLLHFDDKLLQVPSRLSLLPSCAPMLKVKSIAGRRPVGLRAPVAFPLARHLCTPKILAFSYEVAMTCSSPYLQAQMASVAHHCFVPFCSIQLLLYAPPPCCSSAWHCFSASLTLSCGSPWGESQWDGVVGRCGAGKLAGALHTSGIWKIPSTHAWDGWMDESGAPGRELWAWGLGNASQLKEMSSRITGPALLLWVQTTRQWCPKQWLSSLDHPPPGRAPAQSLQLPGWPSWGIILRECCRLAATWCHGFRQQLSFLLPAKRRACLI